MSTFKKIDSRLFSILFSFSGILGTAAFAGGGERCPRALRSILNDYLLDGLKDLKKVSSSNAVSQRPEIPILNSRAETLVTMAEGDSQVLRVVNLLAAWPDDADETFRLDSHHELLIKLDDMNIRGSQIWLGYSDVCHKNMDLFVEKIKNRDPEMVAYINKNHEAHGTQEMAVVSGASHPGGRKRLPVAAAQAAESPASSTEDFAEVSLNLLDGNSPEGITLRPLSAKSKAFFATTLATITDLDQKIRFFRTAAVLQSAKIELNLANVTKAIEGEAKFIARLNQGLNNDRPAADPLEILNQIFGLTEIQAKKLKMVIGLSPLDGFLPPMSTTEAFDLSRTAALLLGVSTDIDYDAIPMADHVRFRSLQALKEKLP